MPLQIKKEQPCIAPFFLAAFALIFLSHVHLIRRASLSLNQSCFIKVKQ